MTETTITRRLYRHPLSGHSHRAELMLSLLGLPFEAVDLDLPGKAHKSAEFLKKNAFGQVPVLEDGPITIADSNAILVYLAARYDDGARFYPRDPVAQAEVQRWLSIAAGQLAYGPAALRLAAVFGAQVDVARAQTISSGLLDVMNQHLASRAFLCGGEPTIADVAMYSYTAHAPEGGVAVQEYAAIWSWLKRIEALPGFVAMKCTARCAA